MSAQESDCLSFVLIQSFATATATSICDDERTNVKEEKKLRREVSCEGTNALLVAEKEGGWC